MPQVTALTIDIGQTPDLQGGSQSTAENYQESGNEFSRLVEQHIVGENNGKKKPEQDFDNGKDGSTVENSADKANSENDNIETAVKTEQESKDSVAEKEAANNDVATKYIGEEVRPDDAKSKAVELLALLDASGKALSSNKGSDKTIASDLEAQGKAANAIGEELNDENNEKLSGEQSAQGIDKNVVSPDSVLPSDKNLAKNNAVTDGEVVTASSIKQIEANKEAKTSFDDVALLDENTGDVIAKSQQVMSDVEGKTLNTAQDKKAQSETKQQSSQLGIDTAQQDKIANEVINAQQTVTVVSASKDGEVDNSPLNNGAEKHGVQAQQVEQQFNQNKVDKVAAQVADAIVNNKDVGQQSNAQTKVVNQSTAGATSNLTAAQLANEQVKTGDIEAKEANAKAVENNEALTNIVRDMPLEAKNNLPNENFVEKPTSTVSSTSTSSITSAVQQQIIMDSALQNNAADPIKLQKELTPLQTETIAIYRKDFANAVKEKVMIMINQKLQQVDIQLDPPELGNVSVRVNLQGEQAAVNFVVQNQQAKDALEQNLAKLKDMLSESGVDVGDANVEQQQQGNNENLAGDDQSSSSRNESFAQNDAQISSINSNLFKASATGVDYYA